MTLFHLNFDMLGDLFGKARRRTLEAQAKTEAQALLDQNKPELITLLLQAVDAVPVNSAADQLPAITQALVGQVLASPALSGKVPPLAQAALGAVVGQALKTITPITAEPAAIVGQFQWQAKGAITKAITDLKL